MTPGGRRLPVIGPVPGAPPAGIERIAVIGLGAVGASLALALRHAWPASLVIGVDTHDVVETAVRLHAIDVGADDLMIAGDADLLLLAGGAEEALRVVPHLSDAVPGNATVVILAPSEALAGALADAPARFGIVAGVPEVTLKAPGIGAADAHLFAGRRWPLRLLAGTDDALAKASALVRAVGAHPGGAPRA